MQYSLLQKDLSMPDVDMFKRALKHVPGFMAVDAHTLAVDALGVVVKHQTQQDAMLLQRALRAEGMETEIVAEASLIPIPPPKVVKRVECRPDTLVIYDALDRAQPIGWRSVLMVAAGNVRGGSDTERFEARRESTMVRTIGSGTSADTGTRGAVSMDSREPQTHTLLLEIITGRAETRYSIKADAGAIFLFQYLGTRRTKSMWDNFTMLVQDLAKYAQNAALNSGAYYMKEGNGEMFSYPTKNAFNEEMTWLLWQMARQSQKPK